MLMEEQETQMTHRRRVHNIMLRDGGTRNSDDAPPSKHLLVSQHQSSDSSDFFKIRTDQHSSQSKDCNKDKEGTCCVYLHIALKSAN